MVKRERKGDTEEMLKRNVNDDGQELSNSTTLFQLKRRRLQNSSSSSTESDNSDDPSASSCCSSNVSSESYKQKLITKDLQEVCSGGDEIATSSTFIIEQTKKYIMKETTPFSKVEGGFSELDSTTMLPATNSRNRLTEAKKPSVDELEAFFSSAERKIQKQVSKKYNFNFEKEEPLEGRYEWVEVKP